MRRGGEEEEEEEEVSGGVSKERAGGSRFEKSRSERASEQKREADVEINLVGCQRAALLHFTIRPPKAVANDQSRPIESEKREERRERGEARVVRERETEKKDGAFDVNVEGRRFKSDGE